MTRLETGHPGMPHTRPGCAQWVMGHTRTTTEQLPSSSPTVMAWAFEDGWLLLDLLLLIRMHTAVEQSGLYDIVLFIWELSAFFEVPEAHIRVAYDAGLSTLWQVQYSSELTNPSCPHCNLIMASYVISLSSWSWSWWHILGHQDGQNKVLDDKWETRNIEMDMDAKLYWVATHAAKTAVHYLGWTMENSDQWGNNNIRIVLTLNLLLHW